MNSNRIILWLIFLCELDRELDYIIDGSGIGIEKIELNWNRKNRIVKN